MQKHIHIIALFFLGIFSMFLLHQVVPHLHHQHEDSHSHVAIAHNDDNHHRDTPEKNDNSKKGFIDFFLAMHTHSIVVYDNIVVLKKTITNQIVVKKDITKQIFPSYSIVYIDYEDVEKPHIYQPPNSYFNPYQIYLDLRGPPTLGLS
ncbi:hypothetical protein JYT89_02405 [Flavobacteriaceae bacterium AH-315-B10]|nr:hypothetical protein [Flavobacteriaceae bacterium AH-315-B10]